MTITGKQMSDRAANRQQSKHDFEKLQAQLTRLGVNSKEVGEGVFSVVIDHGHDPGAVQKVAYGHGGSGYTVQELLTDGYFSYIIKAAQHGMDWNPYLPKVYDIKFYQSKDGLIAFTLEIEKLHNFLKVNSKEAMAMGTKMFGPEFETLIKQSLRRKPVEDEPEKADRIQKMISMFLEQHLAGHKGEDTLKIKDSRLRHALAVASKAMRAMGPDEGFADLHRGNIMVRRTPYGAQPVIIDPIAS